MSLRTLLRVFVPRWPRELTCARCGARFTCGASLAGCWCAEFHLSDTQRAELRGRYRDCLCRTCLEALAAASQSPAS